MGAYLSAPVLDKELSAGEDGALSYGTCAVQGWRLSMEDAHAARLSLGADTATAFFGVFDGHGGAEARRTAARGREQRARGARARGGATRRPGRRAPATGMLTRRGVCQR
jgi:serine/threonine protein phosphatase PrpC